MANKLAIDIELNSKQYTEGAKQAAKSTEDLKKSTDDFIKDFGSLRKQLAAAKKEAQNLAGAYASLSQAEKQSELGKELKVQMDIAIEKAAELQDVMTDTSQAIKNSSSDTQAWDALKEGMEIGKSAALAYAGAVAKLTGNEEDLAKLVKTLTMIENTFNAAIKIGNALQQQSATMTGIRKIQLLAAARAEEIGTAATVKATLAQKAFNLVAKANPYVLLASVAITAAAAIGGYMLATKDATKADKEAKEEAELLEKTREAATEAYNKTSTDLIVTYNRLQAQWKLLKSEGEKTQWIKDNKAEFDKLGLSISSIDDAENVLVNNTKNVVEAFNLRAQAAAHAARAQANYEEALAIDDDYKAEADKWNKRIANAVGDMTETKQQQKLRLIHKRNEELAKIEERKQVQLKKSREETEKEVELLARADRLLGGNKKKDNDNKDNNNKKDVKKITELKQLEAEVTKYKEQIENIDIKTTNATELTKELNSKIRHAEREVENYKLFIDFELQDDEFNKLKELSGVVDDLKDKIHNLDPSLPDYSQQLVNLQDKLKEANKNLTKYKVKIGVEVADPDEVEKELKAAIEKAQNDYKIAVNNDDEAAKQAAKQAYYKAKEELDKYNLSIKIEPKFDAQKFQKQVNDVLENVYKTDSKTWDFSGFNFRLDGEQLQKTAENVVNQVNKIKTAIQELENIKSKTTDVSAKEQTQSMIDNFKKEKDILESKADLYERLAEQEKKHAEAVELNRQSYDLLFSSLGTLSSALQDLGAEEAAQAVEFVANSATMIAQCVQNIAALQAQAIAAGTASGASLPFPANIAAIASIVATITAIFASLAKFENGGVVGGSSYSGDRLLIRVNSGERVLTASQNKNFERIANGMLTPMTQNDMSLMSFRVRGRDLLLVMNNELKSNRKKPIS